MVPYHAYPNLMGSLLSMLADRNNEALRYPVIIVSRPCPAPCVRPRQGCGPLLHSISFYLLGAGQEESKNNFSSWVCKLAMEDMFRCIVTCYMPTT